MINQDYVFQIVRLIYLNNYILIFVENLFVLAASGKLPFAIRRINDDTNPCSVLDGQKNFALHCDKQRFHQYIKSVSFVNNYRLLITLS